MTHGPDLLEWWSDELALGVQVEGLEHLPASGPVILYANHPTGLTDGIALWDAVKAIRPDVKIMMNAQGLDVIPAFRDLLVPVRLGKNGTSTDVEDMEPTDRSNGPGPCHVHVSSRKAKPA